MDREKNSVNIFLKPVVAENIVRENDYEPGEGEDYANRALRVEEQQKRRRVSASKYRPTDHVSPTTNIIERANSQTYYY